MSNKNSNDIDKLFSGARWTLIVGILQKITTFSLNQILVLNTSPEVFGLAAIQLELLLSSLLFLSREGIRIASLRELIDTPQQLQKLVNISWIPFIIIFIVIIIVIIFAFFDDNIDNNNSSITIYIVLMYCCGALFESMGEPWLNLFQNSMQIAPRLKADTIAIFIRSLTTVISVAYLDMGVLGFGLAQMSYGVSHFLTLSLSCKTTPINGVIHKFTDFLPRILPSSDKTIDNDIDQNNKIVKNIINTFTINGNLFEIRTVLVGFTATMSSIIKHLLTEADKIALSISTSNYDQGVFALASNYGSLVARLIFLPIEDASKMAFSKMAADLRYKVKYNDNNDNNIVNEEAGQILKSMSTYLSFLLRALIICGAILPIIGPSYTRLLVHIVFGKKWQSEETVRTLSAFCFYLYALGINGVSEAFVHSVAPTAAFRRVNIGLGVSSFMYVICVIPLLVYVGTSGIVIAGTVSMITRIISSFIFIQGCFNPIKACSYLELPEGIIDHNIFNSKSSFLYECYPPLYFLILTIILSTITLISATRFASSNMNKRDMIEHLSVGVITGLIFIFTLYYRFHKEVKNILYIRKHKFNINKKGN
jgi:oligosaccharide translocation protein RFT1